MAEEVLERRRYIRLNSYCPVGFSLYYNVSSPISEEYQGFSSNISENGLCVSVRNLREHDRVVILEKKAGLKLTIRLSLFIRPINATARIAWCKKDTSDEKGESYLIGLFYEDINPKDKRKIFNYARRLKWFPRITTAVILLLLAGLLALSINHIKIRNTNERLIKELVFLAQTRANVESRLGDIKTSKTEMEAKFLDSKKKAKALEDEIKYTEQSSAGKKERLAQQLNSALIEGQELKNKLAKIAVEKDIEKEMVKKDLEKKLEELKNKSDTLQMELAEIDQNSQQKIVVLRSELTRLESENNILVHGLDEKRQGETSLEEQLAQLKTKSTPLEEVNIDKMLLWVGVHRNKNTGLILSYEGDQSLKDWAFTYDQSLACQLFLIIGAADKAAGMLDFYKDKAKSSNNLFFNAYDVKTGLPTEYTIHSGPNIWIAISACQYTKKTNDKKYLPLAESIAGNMISMQKDSQDGSIRGGPDLKWVSTEHNLDAYALFNMLYSITNKKDYEEAASITLKWLKDIGYNKPEETFLRGKGDATIATDTFSWAIAAVGPKTLLENGMDPNGIMEFAENECKVSAAFYRPEGSSIDITGFDFAKAKNLGRGGIVSTEWTSQMIVAFKIMADYYRQEGDLEKANIYSRKADYYLSQLAKMVISSPSPTGQGEGCLPYASIDDVDTGHGWRVARGRRTGSLSATIYYIFAYKGYNPLWQMQEK